MHPTSLEEIERLVDDANHGDSEARRQLLLVTYDRLNRLVAKILYESFPSLRHQHDIHSIVHETWLRLDQSLRVTKLATAADFFRFASHKIRQVLLDMLERQRKRMVIRSFDSGLSDSIRASEPPSNTYDPRRLGEWTEFHERVDALGDLERQVFELHYYMDVSQADIAKLLELHPRKVSYLWVEATERLAATLGFKDQ